MRFASFACGAVVLAGALTYQLTVAGAQGSPEAREACTPDAMRLCSEFIPDVAKITACMKKRHRELSKECVTAMRNMHHGESRHAERSGEGRHREVRHHEGHHHRVARSHCDQYSHICS